MTTGDTKPRVIRREDLALYRANLAGFQSLWSGAEPPVTWPQWCAALEARDRALVAERQKQADEDDERRKDALEYLAFAASADTHSSDVDPGRVDPWEER